MRPSKAFQPVVVAAGHCVQHLAADSKWDLAVPVADLVPAEVGDAELFDHMDGWP